MMIKIHAKTADSIRRFLFMHILLYHLHRFLDSAFSYVLYFSKALFGHFFLFVFHWHITALCAKTL